MQTLDDVTSLQFKKAKRIFFRQKVRAADAALDRATDVAKSWQSKVDQAEVAAAASETRAAKELADTITRGGCTDNLQNHQHGDVVAALAAARVNLAVAVKARHQVRQAQGVASDELAAAEAAVVDEVNLTLAAEAEDFATQITQAIVRVKAIGTELRERCPSGLNVPINQRSEQVSAGVQTALDILDKLELRDNLHVPLNELQMLRMPNTSRDLRRAALMADDVAEVITTA